MAEVGRNELEAVDRFWDVRMARSNVTSGARGRILGSVQKRLMVEVDQPRLKPRQPKASQPKRTRGASPKSHQATESFPVMAAAKLVILGIVIVSGVAAIIWIRTLGEALGVG